MKITRRDLFLSGAGAVAGLVITPIPWKVLDDVSIWSQNWPWIPQPSRFPIEMKQSFCKLCPHGCAVKVKTAGGWPVGVAGVRNNPISRGALCPFAFGAHQLNWHPQRLRAVRHQEKNASWSDALKAFASACDEGLIVVIDGQPGRAASTLLESFASKYGRYQVVPSAEVNSMMPYESWTGVPARSLGYDFENAQTILSFGVPLLDGWGAPGHFTRQWAERAAGIADPQLRLIQIEPTLSRTAARSWQWVPIQAGAEAALAAGIARVLFEERLVPSTGPVPPLTLEEASRQAGLSSDQIRNLARTVAGKRPAVAIAADNNPSISALNFILGAMGARGGVVARSTRSQHYPASESVIQSARAILIDASVPWNFAPETDAEVFRFAAWNGEWSHADWLLPAPAFLEELTDVPTPPLLPFESYAVAPSLLQTPSGVEGASTFLGAIDRSLDTVEAVIHARCADLFRNGAGTVVGQEATPMAKLESKERFEDRLWKGDVWIGPAARPASLTCRLKEWPAIFPDARLERWPTGWSVAVWPPLGSKLSSESNLRAAPERRRI